MMILKPALVPKSVVSVSVASSVTDGMGGTNTSAGEPSGVASVKLGVASVVVSGLASVLPGVLSGGLSGVASVLPGVLSGALSGLASVLPGATSGVASDPVGL